MTTDPIEHRLIVALDLPTIDAARAVADRLDARVAIFKIGYWLLFTPGVHALAAELVARGKRLFLDIKAHDIPETTARAVSAAAGLGARFITVHAGDPAILRAAAAAAAGTPLRILAVTVLTSQDDATLAADGQRDTARDLARARARQAAECGCHGIIASAADSPDALRAAAGAPGLLVVTPGIRLPTDAADDHRRAATPAGAIEAGADYLVVGRPIVRAPDPAAAAARFVEEMRQGCLRRPGGLRPRGPPAGAVRPQTPGLRE